MTLRQKIANQLRLPCDWNWRLEAPHLRTQPSKPRPEVRSFGFSVPRQLPPKPEPRTTNYYFGNIKSMPPGKYKIISDGVRTNAINQLSTGVKPQPKPVVK